MTELHLDSMLHMGQKVAFKKDLRYPNLWLLSLVTCFHLELEHHFLFHKVGLSCNEEFWSLEGEISVLRCGYKVTCLLVSRKTNH